MSHQDQKTMKFSVRYELTSRVSSKDVVQQSISCKLSNVFGGIFLVQGLQLGLALVELLMVSLKTISTELDSKHLAICGSAATATQNKGLPSQGQCVHDTRTLPL